MFLRFDLLFRKVGHKEVKKWNYLLKFSEQSPQKSFYNIIRIVKKNKLKTLMKILYWGAAKKRCNTKTDWLHTRGRSMNAAKCWQ